MRMSRLSCSIVWLAVILAGACGEDRGTPVGPPPGVAAPVPPPLPPPVPPVTYSVTGTVREVNGGPLGNVAVTSTGHSTVTAADGTFSLRDIVQPVLIFQKPGFRYTYWRRTGAADTESPLVRMQPQFILQKDAPVASILTNDDLTYSSEAEDSFWDSDYFCSPCKEVGVGAGNDGGVRLLLEWTGSTPLDIWTGDYYTGVSASKLGQEDESRLVLDVSPGRLNTLLIGVGRRASQPQPMAGTITFRVTIVPRD